MKLAVVGAGSVGLLLGGRLQRAGCDVRFVTRRNEQAQRLDAEGLRIEDPSTGECATLPAAATAIDDAGVDTLRGRTLLLCVRAGQTSAVAATLARVAPHAAVASAQNGVETDAVLAGSFTRVIGVVVRQTCTRVSDAHVRALAGGRLVVGRHPEGADPLARELAAVLRAAGFDVGLSERIAEDRWLKLAVNLMSAPNALVRRGDHDEAAFVEIKLRLLEEARDVFAAAGITARSCDGRDRCLDAEIAHQLEAFERGEGARRLPLYNQVWTALRRGGPLEADGYHRTLVELARRHGVPAPANARVLAALEAAARSRTGPERLPAADLIAGLPPPARATDRPVPFTQSRASTSRCPDGTPSTRTSRPR